MLSSGRTGEDLVEVLIQLNVLVRDLEYRYISTYSLQWRSIVALVVGGEQIVWNKT